MNAGFRYHVTTIAAIFLALGVGIVIGSSFVQSAIVDRLTHRLEELQIKFNHDVAPLQEQNRRYADFLNGAAGTLLGGTGSISGSRVAIIQTGDYPETVRRIRETLEQGGAIVPNRTLIEPAYPTRLQAVLPKLLEKLHPLHPTLGNDKAAVIRLLAAAITRGGQQPDLDACSEQNLIQQDGDYSQPVNYVVIVGGASDDNENRADDVDVPLISELKALNITIAEAEPEAAAVSYVPALRASDIVTVDDAETDIGRLSVALALHAAPGDYGVKRTARSGLVPLPR